MVLRATGHDRHRSSDSLVTKVDPTMAQGAQCVSERVAMVEIIRAYVRSDAGLLGPQGISESVLAAMAQTQRLFIPGRSGRLALARARRYRSSNATYFFLPASRSSFDGYPSFS